MYMTGKERVERNSEQNCVLSSCELLLVRRRVVRLKGKGYLETKL